MREVLANEIEMAVCELCISANKVLPQDLVCTIKNANKSENNTTAKNVLSDLISNIDAAKELDIPVCQDTGMAVIFAEVGQDVHIVGSFEKAVNDGVARGYTEGLLRKSVVADPLFNRINTKNNTPAILHTRIVEGDKIKLIAAPKGFGSENMSALKMFTPSANSEDIISFVIDTVKKAGSNPCPPMVIGVGIGGDFEMCAYLAKKALCRSVTSKNPNDSYAQLENEMLNRINQLNIGPQGFGGNTTALSLNIETYPTHIAGLPVAVNIGCHVTRHAEKEI